MSRLSMVLDASRSVKSDGETKFYNIYLDNHLLTILETMHIKTTNSYGYEKNLKLLMKAINAPFEKPFERLAYYKNFTNEFLDKKYQLETILVSLTNYISPYAIKHGYTYDYKWSRQFKQRILDFDKIRVALLETLIVYYL